MWQPGAREQRVPLPAAQVRALWLRGPHGERVPLGAEGREAEAAKGAREVASRRWGHGIYALHDTLRPEPVFLSVAGSNPVFGGQVHEKPAIAKKPGFGLDRPVEPLF